MPLSISPTLTPPILPDAWEYQRQQETLLRTRMLEGDWEQDLRLWLERHIGLTRLQGWAGLDMSSNPFRVITDALSVLYDSPPTVRNSSGELAGFSSRYDDDTAGVLENAGLWSIMQTYQARVIGCRQYLLRVTVDADEGGKPSARFRMVSPAFVVAWARPEAPDVPVAIAEARLRDCAITPGGKVEARWTWDYVSVMDPANPDYRVYVHAPKATGGFFGRDISADILGGDFSGDAYPYRFADQTPHLPYIMHHARRGHGRLWTPLEGRELVRGSLNLAVGWSMWYHILRDASWPQRHGVNVVPLGATTDTNDAGDETRAHVVTDPATVFLMQVLDPEVNQTSVGQWEPGGDPATFAEALGVYSARLAQDAGLSGTDIQKTTGNARSGYAISLTNAGKREAQARFREPFAWADTRLLAITAAMVNRATEAAEGVTATSYPEDGYTIEYAAIPLSPDESRARDDHVLKMTEAGYMSKLEGYMLTHPGISEQQATTELGAIAAARATPREGAPNA